MCEKRKKKTKVLSQFLKSHISGTLKVISLKFGIWSTEGGGRVHSKNRLVSSRQHRATEAQKLRFCSSCQYTHGCCTPASWASRLTTVCLDVNLWSATATSDTGLGTQVWRSLVLTLNYFSLLGNCSIIVSCFTCLVFTLTLFP